MPPPPTFVGQAPPPPPIPPVGSALGYPHDEDPLVHYPAVEEAAHRLYNAQILQPGDYYALGTQARQNAFTISGDLTTETIGKVRDILAENLRTGADREAFAEEVADKFEKGLPLSEAHLEQVFRNAVNSAYSDGMDEGLQHPLVQDAFPYRLYFATSDARVRPEHFHLEKTGLNDTNVYRGDDPSFIKLRPPWAWCCRCSWSPCTVEMAAELKVKEAIEWLKRAKETGKELWEVPPTEPEHVVPPTYNGKTIEPPAGWQRM